MYKKHWLVFSFSMVIGLSGCVHIYSEPPRPIKIEDGSSVDLMTQLAPAELIWNSMQRLGCRRTDVIYPEVLEKSPNFQAGKGYIATGFVKERWTAHGCGMKIPYIVDIKANKQNDGGSDVYIRRETGGS
jgi:hypothetical protein